METLVPILTVILIFVLAFIFDETRRREKAARERQLSRRIQTFASGSAAETVSHTGQAASRSGGLSIFTQSELARSLEQWLAQAGIEMPIERFVTIMMLSALGGATLTGMWLHTNIGLLYGLGAIALPLGYAAYQRKKRLSTFSQQLPYVLDFLRSALSAGHTLPRGVQMASENAPEPIATELRLVVEQIRVGASLPDALENMFGRVPEESLAFLVSAVRIQQNVGSSIAEIIDRVTEAIRERQRLAQELKTLTAQSRMSGIIVGILPFALLALFSVLRPEYTKVLFHDPLGTRMLEAAIILDLIALVTINRMVKVE